MDMNGSSMTCFALRLQPGDDLAMSLLEFAHLKRLSSACILTCVGSVIKCKLRMAGAQAGGVQEFKEIDESMEIVSLVGTFSCQRKMHLHMSLSGRNGTVIGGHLPSTGGTIVHTTAEIVIGSLDSKRFERVMDSKTGFPELKVVDKSALS